MQKMIMMLLLIIGSIHATTISPLVGGGCENSTYGCNKDGSGLLAGLKSPYDIVSHLDGGSVFGEDGAIRRIQNGVVTTLFKKDTFYPYQITLSPQGDIFVAAYDYIYPSDGGYAYKDYGVFHFSSSGAILNRWGWKSGGVDTLEMPRGLLYHNNILYVSDLYKHQIFKLGSDGSVTPFIGSGEAKQQDGVGLGASLNSPRALVLGKDGKLWVNSHDNYRDVFSTFSEDGTLKELYRGYNNANAANDFAVDANGVIYYVAGELKRLDESERPTAISTDLYTIPSQISARDVISPLTKVDDIFNFYWSEPSYGMDWSGDKLVVSMHYSHKIIEVEIKSDAPKISSISENAYKQTIVEVSDDEYVSIVKCKDDNGVEHLPIYGAAHSNSLKEQPQKFSFAEFKAGSCYALDNHGQKSAIFYYNTLASSSSSAQSSASSQSSSTSSMTSSSSSEGLDSKGIVWLEHPNRQYYASVSWDEALNYCKSQNATLPSIEQLQAHYNALSADASSYFIEPYYWSSTPYSSPQSSLGIESLITPLQSFKSDYFTGFATMNGNNFYEHTDGSLHLVYVDNYELFYAKSTNGGESFSAQKITTGFEGDIRRASLVVDRDGKVFIGFNVHSKFDYANPTKVSYGTNFEYDIYCANNKNGTWEIENLYTHESGTLGREVHALTVDKENNIILFANRYGWNTYGGEAFEYKRSSTTNSWSQAEKIVQFQDASVDRFILGYFSPHILSSGDMVVTISRYKESDDRRLLFVKKVGGSWQEPVEIESSTTLSTYDFDTAIDASDTIHLGYATEGSVYYRESFGAKEKIYDLPIGVSLSEVKIASDAYGNLSLLVSIRGGDSLLFSKKKESSWSEPKKIETISTNGETLSATIAKSDTLQNHFADLKFAYKSSIQGTQNGTQTTFPSANLYFYSLSNSTQSSQQEMVVMQSNSGSVSQKAKDLQSSFVCIQEGSSGVQSSSSSEQASSIGTTTTIAGIIWLDEEPDGYFGWSEANSWCEERGGRLPYISELVAVWSTNGGAPSPLGFQKDTFYWSIEQALDGEHKGCAMDYDCSNVSGNSWSDDSFGHPKCVMSTSNSSTSDDSSSASSGVSIQLQKGWNLTGNPQVDSYLIDAIADNSILWKYSQGAWSNPTSILPCEGFWIKTDDSKIAQFSSVGCKIESTSLGEGWSLLGAGERIYHPKEHFGVQVVWVYGSGWISNPSYIEVGKGFWVKK